MQIKKWIKNIVVMTTFGSLLVVGSHANAALKKYEFSIGGFSNDGEINGYFMGEDTNGDGYISSFLFSQEIDFQDNDFETGLNEVAFITATYTGDFWDGITNFMGNPVSLTNSNDLTDITDTFFGLFPLDLFFAFNFNLSGSVLGDDPLEGMVLGQADNDIVFGLGQFLPAPAGADVFDAPNGLPGKSTLTSRQILLESNGNPCTGSSACGIMHTVGADAEGNVFIGDFETTNAFMNVREVSAPSALLLSLLSIFAFAMMRKQQ